RCSHLRSLRVRWQRPVGTAMAAGGGWIARHRTRPFLGAHRLSGGSGHVSACVGAFAGVLLRLARWRPLCTCTPSVRRLSRLLLLTCLRLQFCSAGWDKRVLLYRQGTADLLDSESAGSKKKRKGATEAASQRAALD